MPGTRRRLAAILSADVAGFSRLMGVDEAGAHRQLADSRRILDARIEDHGGRIVGTAGDSVLAEFPSVVDAVACAVAAQQELAAHNAGLPEHRRMLFRIGINLGDVIVDGDDIFGEGVNVAARLQGIAAPGGICISAAVHQEVRNKLPHVYRPLGPQRVKNIADPVIAYAVDAADTRPAAPRRSRRRLALPVGLAAAAAALGIGAAALFGPALLPLGEPAVPAPSSAVDRATITLAVLPFANRSDAADQDYFSDGLTEDITSALGRFPNFSVMAPNAVARYKTEPAAPTSVGTALGVRYLVEGSVQRSGEQMRVTARLIDAMTGVQLWSDRYETELEDVLSVQDDITRRIAGRLAVRLEQIEAARALAKPQENLEAYDHLLRGRAAAAKSTRASNREARRMAERAVELAPDYADAYALIGGTYYAEARSGWTETPGESLAKAETYARRALELDPMLPEGRRLLAAYYLSQRRFDEALQELDRALQINPSDSDSLAHQGAILMFAGLSERAAKSLEAALQLDPHNEIVTFNLGAAYYLLERYPDAVRTLERSQSYDRVPLMRAYSQIVLAAAYAQLDRADDATRARDRAFSLYPFFDTQAFVRQFASEEDRRRLSDGLRKAGFT